MSMVASTPTSAPGTPAAPDPPDPPPAGVAVRLRGVGRTFPGGVRVVDGIDLAVASGEFVALLGPSGCGKTTLLRLIAGLDRPDAGTIATDHLRDQKGGIAYVFQDAHLLPWRTVLGNVLLPLELLGTPAEERHALAATAIAQVGLTDAATRYPAQLSGGMRMRASLARALVTGPRLLLLDEPFAALDEITRQGLDDQLRELWARRRMTVLFVTHSIGEATFLAQRAVVLTRRPARVVLDHALDLPRERTASLRTDAAFAGQMKVLYEALRRGGGAP